MEKHTDYTLKNALFFKCCLFVCAHVTVLVILVVGCYLVVYACVIFPRNTYILAYTHVHWSHLSYIHTDREKNSHACMCAEMRRLQLSGDQNCMTSRLFWFDFRFVSFRMHVCICHIAKWNTEEEEFLLIILLFFCCLTDVVCVYNAWGIYTNKICKNL